MTQTIGTISSPSAGDRFEHRKGGTYAIVGTAKVQTDTPLADYAEVVVYRSETDGLVWVRPLAEFSDGRFTAILPDPTGASAREALELSPNDTPEDVLRKTEDIPMYSRDYYRLHDARLAAQRAIRRAEIGALATPVAESEAVQHVDDTRLWWFLHILAACGSAGASACDQPGEWLAAFCDDAKPVDTFNRATNLKLAGWSHDSDTDVARTWITAEGRQWMTHNEPAVRDEGPRVFPGFHTYPV